MALVTSMQATTVKCHTSSLVLASDRISWGAERLAGWVWGGLWNLSEILWTGKTFVGFSFFCSHRCVSCACLSLALIWKWFAGITQPSLRFPHTPPSPSFLALAALGKLFCRGIKRSHKRAKFWVGGWGLVSSLNGFKFFCYVLFKEMHLPMIPVSPVKWINCSITLLIQYCACWCCISIR